MASLAFDATVTAMTVWKAFKIRRVCGPTHSPLIQVFLREGAPGFLANATRILTSMLFSCLKGVFYFVFISIANLVNGIFYLQ